MCRHPTKKLSFYPFRFPRDVDPHDMRGLLVRKKQVVWVELPEPEPFESTGYERWDNHIRSLLLRNRDADWPIISWDLFKKLRGRGFVEQRADGFWYASAAGIAALRERDADMQRRFNGMGRYEQAPETPIKSRYRRNKGRRRWTAYAELEPPSPRQERLYKRGLGTKAILEYIERHGVKSWREHEVRCMFGALYGKVAAVDHFGRRKGWQDRLTARHIEEKFAYATD